MELIDARRASTLGGSIGGGLGRHDAATHLAVILHSNLRPRHSRVMDLIEARHPATLQNEGL